MNKSAAKGSGKDASKRTSKSSAKSSAKSFSKNKAAAKKPQKALTPAPVAVRKPKTAAELIRDNKTLAYILASMNEMKAEETVTIDLSDKSSIGQVMVVATGRSNVHLGSIADRVVKDLKAHGITGIGVEGLRQGDWVLIDAGSVIVHLFRPEVRTFYNIEKMWSA
jgi:ribosome-associated protein